VDIALTWAPVALMVPFTAIMVHVHRLDSAGPDAPLFEAAQPGDKPGLLCPHCLEEGYRAWAMELFSHQNFRSYGFISRSWECPRCREQWTTSYAMGLLIAAPWLTEAEAKAARAEAIDKAVAHQYDLSRMEDMVDQHKRTQESQIQDYQIPRVRIAK